MQRFLLQALENTKGSTKNSATSENKSRFKISLFLLEKPPAIIFFSTLPFLAFPTMTQMVQKVRHCFCLSPWELYNSNSCLWVIFDSAVLKHVCITKTHTHTLSSVGASHLHSSTSAQFKEFPGKISKIRPRHHLHLQSTRNLCVTKKFKIWMLPFNKMHWQVYSCLYLNLQESQS